MIYSDLELSRKLERTEARGNADFVETRAKILPESGAAWIEVAGAYAMFDGVGSPLTQTFGLGVFEDVTAEHLDEIENFFRERGSDIFHEVSPMIDPSHMALLAARGYRPMELTSVMYRELRIATDDNRRDAETPREDPSENSASRRLGGLNFAEVQTRIVDASEVDLWAETSAAGWATEGGEELATFIRQLGAIAARTSGGYPFLAEVGGRPIAAGGFQMYDDVCILAGASTIPDARRQGAQNALLRARLRFAIENGCNFAMMCAMPGSQSQKNAQKNGFEIAYTRTKWHLPL
ncbi:MAG TPA: GNAT family N-acetyltransferase [Pyrinomonadaceae bacterium]|nr:GNAT family N-acetyltransferase [Pyrinomonadaceae bacterium]